MNTEKEIVKAIVDLIRQKAFYGHILQQLDKIYVSGESAKVPTMAVGKKNDEMLLKLFINKDFVDHIFEVKEGESAWECLLAILEHEVLHLVFDHLSLKFSDKLRGNIAVDIVVNCCLDVSKLTDGCVTHDLYDFPPNKNAFWYYQNLKDNKNYQDQCKSGAFGAEGLFSDAVNSHKLWESTDDPILSEFVKDIIRTAKNLCNNSYGDIPGEVIEHIDQLLKTKKPIIPWQKVFRTFCASATENNLNYTMKRISKRFGTRPGTRKEDVLNLAVAVDTSGSINDNQLEIFFNEISWIWKNGAIVTVYEADCQICDVYKFKGKFKGEVAGRGGTHLEPVLQEVERAYDALIYFTDFYAPTIEKKYNIPILWVLTTELNRDQFPYKWGRFIKIDDGIAQSA